MGSNVQSKKCKNTFFFLKKWKINMHNVERIHYPCIYFMFVICECEICLSAILYLDIPIKFLFDCMYFVF